MKRLLLILILALPCVQALCCTTAIVSAGASRTGRPMIWKQRDGDVYTCVAHVRGPKYAYTGLFLTVDTLYRKAYAGVNEAGFAIANNLSYNVRPDSVKTGPENGAFMTEALGLCATLADFEQLLAEKEAPRDLSANFAVIDACGGAAYFEVSDDTVVRYDVPEGGFLYRTNYSLSGDEERRVGLVRYMTIERMMQRRAPRKFDAPFFFHCSRDFVNVLTGGNALRFRYSGYIYDRDFIPRASTSSAVVIEGVAPGERADSGLMWCIPGYPPCSYAVPVWVAAGEQLPSIITGMAPANQHAEFMRSMLGDINLDSGYLKVKPLRWNIKLSGRFERREYRAGRRLDRAMRRKGIDQEAVKAYNAAADARFNDYQYIFKI